jgi:hypothetical protein
LVGPTGQNWVACWVVASAVPWAAQKAVEWAVTSASRSAVQTALMTVARKGGLKVASSAARWAVGRADCSADGWARSWVVVTAALWD